ncbi:uncharacterized protein LOC116198813 [Punica granatum]|uniref:Uncharacterized protein LOC116198813 n=1 Tax=Punica granatum TaxID=22663 RepID=A0A218W0A4_PUNGR|nr:uncharacterized protein LOC116198813 [Punica granatum]OWM65730.1 hypothetical protein CDL15_Pgr015154 [Punica granatum]
MVMHDRMSLSKEYILGHQLGGMRVLSFASSPSISSPSSSPDDSPRTPIHSSGIPFSWEHLPGIPKKQIPTATAMNKEDSSSSRQVVPLSLFLPLPPSAASSKSPTVNLRKKSSLIIGRSQLRDPFAVALVECSKDDDIISDASCRGGGAGFWIGARLSRSISDRFGFASAFTTSCKRSCVVAQSIIHLPSTGGDPGRSHFR